MTFPTIRLFHQICQTLLQVRYGHWVNIRILCYNDLFVLIHTAEIWSKADSGPKWTVIQSGLWSKVDCGQNGHWPKVDSGPKWTLGGAKKWRLRKLRSDDIFWKTHWSNLRSQTKRPPRLRIASGRCCRLSSNLTARSVILTSLLLCKFSWCKFNYFIT